LSRNIISIIFATLFLVLLTAPSIIVMIDDSIDISVFYASSEEEEKGSEKNKDIEIFFSAYNAHDENIVLSEVKNNLGYSLKNYPKIHLNLISPPPESIKI
jgi:hypothetical protein